MSNATVYIPPEAWVRKQGSGGKSASINRPVAAATHDKDLPVGRLPLQLYSLAIPNGVKVTVMLEELLALGHGGAESAAILQYLAEEIAAPVVNKEHVQYGESAQASPSSINDISSSRRGGLRSHQGAGVRTLLQLRNETRLRGLKGRSSMNKAQLEQGLTR